MFVYKKLKASDAGITAFEAHKEFNINKDNTSSLGISLINSSYSSASKDTYSQFNLNKELQYFQLDHLFYKDSIFNIGNLNGGINYLDQEKRLYNNVPILSVSQKNFGSSIQKGTINFNNAYIDDSKGNIYSSSINLNDYPVDKERVFYLGPVKGFKRTDLTRNLKTGELVVNYPSTYNDKKLDDSLYTNPVQYISCSIEHISDLNCTGIQLENGYVKVPHSNNFNFGDENFTITFFYKTSDTTRKYILAKSKSQTVVQSPSTNLDGSLKNTHGSSSLLQATEVDAGKAFPFEIEFNRNITFRRSDQDTTSEHTSTNSLTNNTLYHVACVKTGSDLKIYIDGVLSNGTGTDNTDLCTNKADLFIGTNPDISQNKLDNTNPQQVSQLMIWNRGLSETEIINVSESIDGSPYVGNVFYENGIITFTSPSINNTLTTTTNYSPTILLNPTEYITEGGFQLNLTDLTFSSSLFTFYNEETVLSVSSESLGPSLIYDSNLLEFDYDSGPTDYSFINFTSKTGDITNLYTINPINSESFDTYDSYADLSSIMTAALPGAPGTSSGETGTDNDSYTILINNVSLNSTQLALNELQTVTESINILFASNSQEIVTENIPDTDTQITDTVFAFGNTDFTDTSGDSYELTNDGGEYISADAINRSILLVSGSNDNGAFFQGQLVGGGGPGTQTIYDESYNQVSFTSAKLLYDDNITYIVPDGLDQGSDFDDNNDLIEILETPENGALDFQVTCSIVNITGFPGSGGTFVSARLRKTTSGGTFTVSTFESNTSIGEDTSYTIKDSLNGVSATVGDQFFLEVRITTTWPGAGLTSYQLQNRHFKVMGENAVIRDGFKNNLTLQHTLGSIKSQSIYQYRLNGIRTRLTPAQNTYPIHLWGSGNTNLGLSKDINNNDVGVRVTVFQGNTRITSSLFPSSSGAGQEDFSFDYFTDTNTDDLKLFVYPGISSTFTPVFSGKTQGFAIEDDFTITEKSGSFTLKLSQNLSDHFTSSANVTNTLISGFIPEDDIIYTNNPTGTQITSYDYNNNEITVGNIYFITSSINATASFDRGNFISGSASIDITDTKGLYRLDNVTVNTQYLDSSRKVRTQVKKNGTVIDTKYASPGSISNLYQSDPDKLQLGVLDNTDNISMEFTLVDSNNNIATADKNWMGTGGLEYGIHITKIELRKLTSSNEITRVDGGIFNINLSELRFSSSHIDTGDADLPFNVGQITASISSFSGDNKIAYVDTNYFITSSLSDSQLYKASGVTSGPFIISASYEFSYEVGKEYDFNFGAATLINEPTTDNDTNTGVGFRVLDTNNSIIAEYGPQNSGIEIIDDTNYIKFNESGTGKLLLFVSGVSSPLYPNGIVTASGGQLDYTASLEAFNLDLIARSGSYTSNGVTVTSEEFTEGYASSSLLLITSSHNAISTAVEPVLTIGQSVVGITERTNDGNITVNTPLFITSSTQATGSQPTESAQFEVINAVPTNPLITPSATNENMLGGTFTYTNPISLDTQTVTITALTDNGDGTTDIELNNGQGLFQVGTYDNQVPQSVNVNYSITTANPFTLQFKNTHLIFENEFHCTVEEDDFNFTLNPTARKHKSIERGELANFATGSNFKPYVTTIGLYNEKGELLVIGKLGQPVRMSDETDTTFVVRFDT